MWTSTVAADDGRVQFSELCYFVETNVAFHFQRCVLYKMSTRTYFIILLLSFIFENQVQFSFLKFVSWNNLIGCPVSLVFCMCENVKHIFLLLSIIIVFYCIKAQPQVKNILEIGGSYCPSDILRTDYKLHQSEEEVWTVCALPMKYRRRYISAHNFRGTALRKARNTDITICPFIIV